MMTILHFVVVAATFILLSRVLPGVHVTGWGAALFGALILAVMNAIVRPILFILTFPITLVTFGLFLLVLNAITLMLTSALVPGLDIDGWGTAIVAALIISIVGMLWKAITKDVKKSEKV